ncbi:MAG: PilZ domain-containing protein [Pyrinomonadaceae bacterium]
MATISNPKRSATRLAIPVPVTLEWVSETGDPVQEETITQDISRMGAAVFSALPLERGRYLRVSNQSYGVSLLASVRNRTTSDQGQTRLHLQFLKQEWPLDIV